VKNPVFHLYAKIGFLTEEAIQASHEQLLAVAAAIEAVLPPMPAPKR